MKIKFPNPQSFTYHHFFFYKKKRMNTVVVVSEYVDKK